MQPVLLQGEEEAAQKAGLSESMNKEDRVKTLEMFKIDDDEEEQNAENQSKLTADQQQPQHVDQGKEESKKAANNEDQN